MPIPKHFVRDREDAMMVDSSNDEARFSSVLDKSTTNEVTESNSSLADDRPESRKKLSVRWSDQESGEDCGKSSPDNCGTSRKTQKAARGPSTRRPSMLRRSPSPPISLTTKELQEHISRQEAAIRNACKLELKLLNQSKQVRDKRVRMVDRLKRLKRKVRKHSVSKSNEFLFPPVFRPGGKKGSPVIDITKSSETIGDQLVVT